MKNFPKLFLFSLILFSIFLLAYVFYRSEIYHSGDKIDYYLKYYILSISIFLSSIIIIFLSDNFKLIVSIILISTLSSFYLIETYNKSVLSNYILRLHNQVEQQHEIHQRVFYYLMCKNYHKSFLNYNFFAKHHIN